MTDRSQESRCDFLRVSESCEEVFGPTPGLLTPNPSSHPRMVMRPASQCHARPIRWLEPDRIALGKLTLLAGDPGLGKSYLTLDLAARVSRGDASVGGVPGDVLILSAEDDPEDTIRPRLEAMGADLARTIIVDGVVAPNGRVCRAARLDDDMRVLAHTARSLNGLRLIIIDPISAYLGKTDSHNNSEVRAVLTELARLARWTGAAVVCVTHLNKDATNQKKAVYRAMGSLAFTAAARAVLAVSKHPDHADKRVVSMVKSNIGQPTPSRVFRIDQGTVRWLGEDTAFDADTLEGGADTIDQASALDEALDFLKQLLRDGPVPAVDGGFHASALGLSERTVSRARRRLGVQAVRVGKGRHEGAWWWKLPEQAAPAPREPDQIDALL